MARPSFLLVVVVRDPSLRAALAGELGRTGIRLIVPGSDPHGLIRGPRVLLLDEGGLAGEAGQWIEAQWLAGRWRRVAVLTVDAPVPADDREWLVFVEHGSVADRLSGLIGEWGAIDAAA